MFKAISSIFKGPVAAETLARMSVMMITALCLPTSGNDSNQNYNNIP